ncbi:group II intron maturase-specific domain-containing protein [Cupriavidus pinatubonensis]|nr:group II intron maturase-specific domain-containing protein [Cupriavidus pinatubonensis]
MRGWIGYFQHTQSKTPLEELDGWLRRLLACYSGRPRAAPPAR